MKNKKSKSRKKTESTFQSENFKKQPNGSFSIASNNLAMMLAEEGHTHVRPFG